MKEKPNVVYSTDSEEHRDNIGELPEGFDQIGLIQDKDGSWYIDPALMDV